MNEWVTTSITRLVTVAVTLTGNISELQILSTSKSRLLDSVIESVESELV